MIFHAGDEPLTNLWAVVLDENRVRPHSLENRPAVDDAALELLESAEFTVQIPDRDLQAR